MFALIFAALLTCQVPPVEPGAIRAVEHAKELRNEVKFAHRDAMHWAYYRTAERYPATIGLGMPNGKERRAYFKAREHCYMVFRNAAYNRVCEEYEITGKQLEQVVLRDDTVRIQVDGDLTHDPGIPESRNYPPPKARGRSQPTQHIDFTKIRLPAKDAEFLKYTNPPETTRKKLTDPREIANQGMEKPAQ